MNHTPTQSPRLRSHALALFMPFTMIVLVPYWILTTYSHHTPHPVVQIGGIGLIIASFILFASTLQLFAMIGRGTLAPWNPTKNLITSGPYLYCRNPMISGVLGIILGEAVAFGSWQIAVWGLIFFAVNTIYFIALEEPTLQRKFGHTYATYKQRTPRWLPNFFLRRPIG